MKSHIRSKIEELVGNDVGLFKHGALSEVLDLITEFDYATKYLSRLLKVKPFVVYLLLFKRAYFEEGKNLISVTLSELGKNLLSDSGNPMSDNVVGNAINDLVKLKIVEKRSARTGQANKYEVRLPSEIRKVQEMIKREEETEEIIDDSKDDFYKDLEKRLEILKREDYECFYCLRELQEDNFHLDHLVPQAQGGQDYKSNLVASCKECNNKKKTLDPEIFLRENYRKHILTQEEFQIQEDKLTELRKEYRRIEHS